jgi:sulfur carrier protein ThiS
MITVMVRSFIPPSKPMSDFRLGESFEMTIPERFTVGELAQSLLSKNVNQAGIFAVNGKPANEDTILSQGDRIDLYALLDGG